MLALKIALLLSAGVLVGYAIIVMRMYATGVQRGPLWHISIIATSHVILVVGSCEVVLAERVTAPWRIILLLVSYSLSIWALWYLARANGRFEKKK